MFMFAANTTLLPKNAIILTSYDEEALSQLRPIARTYAQAMLEMGGAVALLPSMKNTIFLRKKKNRGGWGLIYSGHISGNGASNSNLTNFKKQCNVLLADAGIPTPKGAIIKQADWTGDINALDLPDFPVVAKPNAHTVKGLGVVTNIHNADDLKVILDKLFVTYNEIIIEEYITAENEFRVLVLDGGIVGIVQRIPAYVVGDGTKTIQALIDEKNIEREAQEAGLIKIDDDLHQTLGAANISLETIPAAGEHVSVKKVCNFGSGGEIRVLPTEAHEGVEKIAHDIAAFTGLRLVGIDVKADSVTVAPEESGLRIIELNPNPDIAMHGFEDSSVALDIAKQILRMKA